MISGTAGMLKSVLRKMPAEAVSTGPSYRVQKRLVMVPMGMAAMMMQMPSISRLVTKGPSSA